MNKYLNRLIATRSHSDVIIRWKEEEQKEKEGKIHLRMNELYKRNNWEWKSCTLATISWDCFFLPFYEVSTLSDIFRIMACMYDDWSSCNRTACCTIAYVVGVGRHGMMGLSQLFSFWSVSCLMGSWFEMSERGHWAVNQSISQPPKWNE